MTQTERITLMENYSDEAAQTLKAFAESLKAYRDIQPKLRTLAEYYAGQDWRNDFDDDQAGKLPQNLKRGVISEDSLYNLLSQNAALQSETLEVIAEILKGGRF